MSGECGDVYWGVREKKAIWDIIKLIKFPLARSRLP